MLTFVMVMAVVSGLADPRNAQDPWGVIYPSLNGTGYSDQPQVVTFNSSYWLCVLTCSPGHEGQRSQIAGITTSVDGGKTWSFPPGRCVGHIPSAGCAHNI